MCVECGVLCVVICRVRVFVIASLFVCFARHAFVWFVCERLCDVVCIGVVCFPRSKHTTAQVVLGECVACFGVYVCACLSVCVCFDCDLFCNVVWFVV